MSEYEIEPAPGIPEPLPEGELILWQGAPSWTSLSAQAFHVKAAAIYFTALLAWNVSSRLRAGDDVVAFATHMVLPLALAVVALGLLASLALLIARTTLYTITNRRVIMRCGIALPIVLNIPFKRIVSAGFAVHADGKGDIVLSVSDEGRPAFAMLWPHVRPRHIARPEPMLRGLRDIKAASQILSQALAASSGQAVQAIREPARTARPIEARPMTPNATATA